MLSLDDALGLGVRGGGACFVRVCVCVCVCGTVNAFARRVSTFSTFELKFACSCPIHCCHTPCYVSANALPCWYNMHRHLATSTHLRTQPDCGAALQDPLCSRSSCAHTTVRCASEGLKPPPPSHTQLLQFHIEWSTPKSMLRWMCSDATQPPSK